MHIDDETVSPQKNLKRTDMQSTVREAQIVDVTDKNFRAKFPTQNHDAQNLQGRVSKCIATIKY
jgi:hypothetical protein